MKKSLKLLHAKFLIPTIFFGVFALFLSAPKIFMQSFLDGLTVWAVNVLPAIFPFAVLTPLAVKFFPKTKHSFCKSLFGVPADNIFVVSLLCGYPVGAKAIAESNLDESSALTACAFCSTAGPVFLIATVGATLLQSGCATVILIVSHFSAAILCGVFFRRKRKKIACDKNKPTEIFAEAENNQNASFGDIGNAVTNAVLSVLTVGGLIALFYMLVDMVKSLFPNEIAQSAATGFVLGLLEMTNGIVSVCETCDTFSATVLCSFLSAFGGMCVFAQSMTFLSKKMVKASAFLKIKLLQSSIATILAFALGKIFGL